MRILLWGFERSMCPMSLLHEKLNTPKRSIAVICRWIFCIMCQSALLHLQVVHEYAAFALLPDNQKRRVQKDHTDTSLLHFAKQL